MKKLGGNAIVYLIGVNPTNICKHKTTIITLVFLLVNMVSTKKDETNTNKNKWILSEIGIFLAKKLPFLKSETTFL